MKRHEALAPLSREHHSSLILAQLLKKEGPVYNGLPADDAGKAIYALEQFNSEIQQHFEKEEMMLEKVKDCVPGIDSLATEIKNEHRQLTALFHSLDAAPGLADKLNTLGITLENHIRKEERVLFPLLQQHCAEDLLAEIHTILH